MSNYAVGREVGVLRISGIGVPGHGATVELDGQNIAPALTGLTVRLGVDERPRATLDVLLSELAAVVDNPQVVILPETRDLLVRLGWTPPAEESS